MAEANLNMDVDNQTSDEVFDHFLAMVKKKEGLVDAINKHRCSESLEDLLHRFLTAASRNTDAAVTMLVEDLAWRDQVGTLELSSKTFDEVLASHKSPETVKSLLMDMVPHGFLGFDKKGRPVSYRKITNRFDSAKMEAAGFDSDANLRFNTWILERVCKAMGDKGQWVVIVDMSEWSLWQFSPGNMALANQVTVLSSKHFPERMGTTIIVNAPFVFGACWQVAKSWVNERILAKIGLYSGPDQWKPELEKILDLDILPEELGGKTKLTYSPQHTLDPGMIPPQKEQN